MRNVLQSVKSPQRRNFLTFGTGVLMCLFGVSKIIWGLKFGIGEIIWGLQFLLCHF